MNALSLATRWSKTTLYDTYASKELRIVDRLLKNQQFKKAFGDRLTKAFVKQLKSASSTANRFDDNVVPALKTVMKVRNKLYTAALATSGQIVLQSSSGFVAAAVMTATLNPLTWSKNLGKAVSAASSSTFGSDTNILRQFIKDS